jgi:hypothetical protein
MHRSCRPAESEVSVTGGNPVISGVNSTIVMPRFAVLTHDHPFLHWDFLLEHGAACRTWRLLAEPGHHDTIPAEALPDHRLMYLDYEGPVGGDRGTVHCWDAGTFEWLADRENEIEVRLSGRRLDGVVRLALSDGVWVWTQCRCE